MSVTLYFPDSSTTYNTPSGIFQLQIEATGVTAPSWFYQTKCEIIDIQGYEGNAELKNSNELSIPYLTIKILNVNNKLETDYLSYLTEAEYSTVIIRRKATPTSSYTYFFGGILDTKTIQKYDYTSVSEYNILSFKAFQYRAFKDKQLQTKIGGTGAEVLLDSIHGTTGILFDYVCVEGDKTYDYTNIKISGVPSDEYAFDFNCKISRCFLSAFSCTASFTKMLTYPLKTSTAVDISERIISINVVPNKYFYARQEVIKNWSDDYSVLNDITYTEESGDPQYSSQKIDFNCDDIIDKIYIKALSGDHSTVPISPGTNTPDSSDTNSLTDIQIRYNGADYKNFSDVDVYAGQYMDITDSAIGTINQTVAIDYIEATEFTKTGNALVSSIAGLNYSVVLGSGSDTDDFYNGMEIQLPASGGGNAPCEITDYTGSTLTLLVTAPVALSTGAGKAYTIDGGLVYNKIVFKNFDVPAGWGGIGTYFIDCKPYPVGISWTESHLYKPNLFIRNNIEILEKTWLAYENLYNVKILFCEFELFDKVTINSVQYRIFYIKHSLKQGTTALRLFRTDY